LNLCPFSSLNTDEIVHLNISQSVYTDAVVALLEVARKSNKTAKIHIKVDTGLGRVGVPYYNALPFIEKMATMQEISIEGIYTTFTEDKEFDKIQLGRFLQVCESVKKLDIKIGLRHAVTAPAS
jgi:alanine racemase